MNLIERLRHPATAQIYSSDVQAMREAANEIERLTAERDMLVEALRDVLSHGGIGNVHQISEALAKVKK